MEPERNPTLSPLPSSLQLPPNLRVSCRVAPRTVQPGVVRTGGVEIVLPIIDRFYSDGSIGFYVRGFEKSFYLSFRIKSGLGWH